MENYEVVGLIGKGSFGSVSKIRRKSDDRILVWKEMNYGQMEEKEKQLLVQEVNILQKLRHPHIVRYYDRIIDRENTILRIVMEYCPAGDLAVLIKKCRTERTHIDEEVIWKVLMQILGALSECHNRKDGVILHRDIKPGNIFLDQGRNVKLGDFGLARVLGKNSLFAHTYVGTPFYMSPEQMNGIPYNEKCDIWSLGCLIYEMAALVPPFEASTQLALAVKIKSGRFARIPAQFSDELQKVISMMLSTDRSRRPSTEELLVHPPILYRIRERKINQHYAALKKKEDELVAKEADLKERERKLAVREQEVASREQTQLMSLRHPTDSNNKENDLHAHHPNTCVTHQINHSNPNPSTHQTNPPSTSQPTHPPQQHMNSTQTHPPPNLHIPTTQRVPVRLSIRRGSDCDVLKLPSSSIRDRNTIVN